MGTSPPKTASQTTQSVDRAASDNRKHAEREADRHSPTRDRVDDDGHNDEDFDNNLSQHRKGDNDHTRQHLGGFPPLRPRGREDNHSTGSSEKRNQRDRNREELFRPDHVSVRSSYSRRSVGTDRRRGSGRHVQTDSQTRYQISEPHPATILPLTHKLQLGNRDSARAQRTTPKPTTTLSRLGLTMWQDCGRNLGLR